MARENYFLLLGLDCSVTDDAVIEAALRNKQAEWSREKDHPERGRQAQDNLEKTSLIRALLTNSTQRAEEARECQRLRAEKETKATAELDGVIELLSITGHLLESQVADLTRQFQGRFSDSQIRQRIKVPILEKSQERPKPPIDPSVFRGMLDRLQIVEKADLYDFLDLRANASLASLAAKAKETSDEIRKFNEKTARLTARQELVNYCLRYFSNGAEREKYDKMLAMQGLLALETLIELAGSGGVLSAEVVEELLLKARERGIAAEDARTYIIEFAQRRRISVQVPPLTRIKAYQRCACSAINPESSRNCGRCGDPLKIECPRCQLVGPSENQACSNCGFAVGDMSQARRLLRDASVALAHGEVDRAVILLAEAKVFWPGSAEIDRLHATARERRDLQSRAYRRVVEALENRRLLEARAALTELRSLAPTHPELDELRRKIELGLRSAEEHVSRAKAFEQRGQTDDAVLAYAEAVRECRDLAEAVEGATRFPPEPPPNLHATASVDGVSLSWSPSLSRGPILYRVVRKIGSEPRTAGDGIGVGDVATRWLTDSNAPAGELVYYAAFAERGGVVSGRAAIAGPILRLAEVSDLRSIAGDGRVALQWNAPARAVAVEVWRQERTPPGRRYEGNLVKGTSLNSASDTGLANSREYGYRVVSLFRGPDGESVASDGVVCSVVPMPPPRPVLDLSVLKRGTQYEATWTPPPRGEVHLYEIESRIPEFETKLSLADLNSIGNRVPSIGRASAAGQIVPGRVVHLVPVTVDGSVAVVGRSLSMSWIDDVTMLSASFHDGILRARWGWPADVDAALVLVREDRHPEGVDDPSATQVLWMKYQFEREGGFVRAWPQKAERLFLVVHAAVPQGTSWIHAPGDSPGARTLVEVGRKRIVKFALKPIAGRWGLGRSGTFELSLTPDAATELPSLILVAKPGGRPLSPTGLKPILRIPGGTVCKSDQSYRETFRPAGLEGKHGVWLFAERDADCSWLDLQPEIPAGYWID